MLFDQAHLVRAKHDGLRPAVFRRWFLAGSLANALRGGVVRPVKWTKISASSGVTERLADCCN